MTGGARGKGDEHEVPELDFPVSRPQAKAAPVSPPAPGAPPRAAPAHGVELSPADDDDDMVVDRNIMPDVNAPGAARPTAPHRGRIEIGAPMANDSKIREGSHDRVSGRRARAVLVYNAVLVAVVALGASAALWRFAHRAAGWSVAPLARPALDGGSALWSGAASLVSLAGCIALAIAGMYAKPRSWGYLLSSFGMLVAAVAMITVTFSVGPGGAPEVPPDGARLVPFALPLVPMGVALRLVYVAWERCDEGRASERLRGALVAMVAAGLAFAAVELAYGAGLARLF